MTFEDFLKRGEVRKSSKDVPLAKSLLKNVKKDLKFLKSLEINENSSRKMMGNYYDSLRGVLEAAAIIDGYKIYSHEAFTYYLREKDENALSVKFDRFRKIRNSINYYGEDISVDECKENIEKIGEMIKVLIDKYLKDLDKK